ncbi:MULTISPECIES: DUF5412 family protein [Brevibacillus]|uniref:DUF5412 domain-containing protein n=1 Tax=Brevibacillus invocatus TaxID=173959 RepID=A0A3M8BGR1_9BACL|nr:MULTISPECIES: DUF5412 family protein [Brevibacillus]MCM3082108.1 DUF5412 domain-containing protein [Brevibacillus invocatus]MCM3432510.1 DUF5412 domain-containing protein [Brevibacillus invocatus]MDH4620203.1 hypothetical protein [Brevibacillus sp. AY1]RNB62572.1 hypothetical protein EDM52_24310 [Brevibacillus invocatus]
MDKQELRSGIEAKRIKRKVYILLTGFTVILFGVLGYGVYWMFFDINRLPKSLMIEEKISPNGFYTVKAYLSDSGATTSYSVVAELIFNKEHNRTKNIYFKNNQHSVEIRWVDNNTVVINGVELVVPNDVYDYRWE